MVLFGGGGSSLLQILVGNPNSFWILAAFVIHVDSWLFLEVLHGSC